ncbi:hypothetical protein ACFOOK_07560 [Micromonospora krabiensis]|uniref:Uncharacterized protein n=1 Tax=Micromonospora krabiensis TaxID=307121 RepID=A0A1C3NC32_9ACTN|nr:hypothetical protein [Micromonospora krabiensis]SBV30145.1 hypothetical protein GA0070620_5738 [Micromonospora krabiensis]
MTTTTIGYLFTNPDTGSISLAVPCEPCATFHWHGAGTVARPLHAPGEVTERVSHCPNGNDYTTITIQPEPYRRAWVTGRRGRFSAAYRRAVTR